MSNQPLDKGRLVAVVEKYPSRTEFDQNNQPKMKNKYMAIGEVTRWPNDQGGHYDTIKQYLNPPHLPCETRIFWDSESNNNQAAPQQQAPQQGYQQPQGGYQR